MLILYVFLSCGLYWSVNGYLDSVPCVTPNFEVAHCVSIFSCPALMQAMGKSEQSSIEFVKNSVCPGWAYEDLKVCCGSCSDYINRSGTTRKPVTPSPTLSTFTIRKITNFETLTTRSPHTPTTRKPPTTTRSTKKPSTTTSSTTQLPTTQHTVSTVLAGREEAKKLLPSRRYCGYQHTDDRLYTDSATALDEFPWIAHVVFLEDEDEDTEQYLDRCNGVLINNRYVLTSDYCATYASKVRLGQYNTNRTVTCIANPSAPECTDPWLDVEVEEEIHRLDFGIQRDKIEYNLALLRLKEVVSFSDFIRPICLPLEASTRPKPNQIFYYSGWGSLNPKMIEKKRLKYNIALPEHCYKLDKEYLKATTANVTLMCLKPREPNQQLACTGDEAGPILYSNRHQWFAEGIIMKVYHDGGDGAERCSNTYPITALKITPDVIDWILDNIKS